MFSWNCAFSKTLAHLRNKIHHPFIYGFRWFNFLHFGSIPQSDLRVPKQIDTSQLTGHHCICGDNRITRLCHSTHPGPISLSIESNARRRWANSSSCQNVFTYARTNPINFYCVPGSGSESIGVRWNRVAKSQATVVDEGINEIISSLALAKMCVTSCTAVFF